MSSNNDPSFEAAAEKAKEETMDVDKVKSEVDASGTKSGAAAEIQGELVYESNPEDVLSGRGANVNNHQGNKKFRALCFVRKPLFDRGNHAAKRRIATEIVHLMTQPTDGSSPARFLKKTNDKQAPFYLMTEEQAISKAQQVMRDYKRPDRIAHRMNLEATGQLRRRNRTTVSTPLDEVSTVVKGGSSVNNI